MYATVPIYKMGVLVMYDQYHAIRALREFDSFKLSDVDQAFRQIRQLKYQQFVRLKGDSLLSCIAGAGRLAHMLSFCITVHCICHHLCDATALLHDKLQ